MPNQGATFARRGSAVLTAAAAATCLAALVATNDVQARETRTLTGAEAGRVFGGGSGGPTVESDKCCLIYTPCRDQDCPDTDEANGSPTEPGEATPTCIDSTYLIRWSDSILRCQERQPDDDGDPNNADACANGPTMVKCVQVWRCKVNKDGDCVKGDFIYYIRIPEACVDGGGCDSSPSDDPFWD